MTTPIYASLTRPDYSIENGTYPAILFQIINIGAQEFGKNTPKPWFSPQILLGFELPTMKYDTQNGEVSSIKSGTYFLSMNPSRNGMVGLREIIDGLRGSSEYTEEQLEKFDISAFLGKECEIVLDGVESKGQVYQNIVGVTPYTGADKLESFRKPIIVSIDDFSRLDEINLPDWIKNKIMLSKEYREQYGKEFDAQDSSMEKFNQDLESAREIPAPIKNESLALDLDDEEESAEEKLKKVQF